MKKSRYTEEQIAFALKQAEMGTPVADVCRKLGVAEQTFYRWKNKYGGMLPCDVKRMKQLEEENAKLKKLVADLSLNKIMLQDDSPKNGEACLVCFIMKLQQTCLSCRVCSCSRYSSHTVFAEPQCSTEATEVL